MRAFHRAVVAAVVFGAVAFGAPIKSPTAFPDTWVNGGPYSLEGVKGKLVVMYFFEES